MRFPNGSAYFACTAAISYKFTIHIAYLQRFFVRALNMILKEKRQTDTALNNLMAAIEQGIISNTTNKRLHELESKQEELERQILIEKSKLALQLSEDTVRKFYTDALKAEPKLLIDCLIKEISCTMIKLKSTLTVP